MVNRKPKNRRMNRIRRCSVLVRPETVLACFALANDDPRR
jgi:hypothetical protein